MATKRTGASKNTEKKPALNKTDLKVTKSEPMCLLPLEFERLEKHRFRASLRQRDQEILQLRLEKIERQREILKLKVEVTKVDEAQVYKDIEAWKRRESIERAENEKDLQAIRDRLGIEGGFGFHPETLEVMQS